MTLGHEQCSVEYGKEKVFGKLRLQRHASDNSMCLRFDSGNRSVEVRLPPGEEIFWRDNGVTGGLAFPVYDENGKSNDFFSVYAPISVSAELRDILKSLEFSVSTTSSSSDSGTCIHQLTTYAMLTLCASSLRSIRFLPSRFASSSLLRRCSNSSRTVTTPPRQPKLSLAVASSRWCSSLRSSRAMATPRVALRQPRMLQPKLMQPMRFCSWRS